MTEYVSGFRTGLFIGALLGSFLTWAISNAQFYPGMSPEMRDLQLQRMFQEQQDHNLQEQQQWKFDYRKPC